MINKNLSSTLEKHYSFFDKSQISPDPLEFPHRYKLKHDIEISAFISSVFAYGNVTQIIKSLEKIHNITGDSPKNFIEKFSHIKGEKIFGNIKHRFYSANDIIKLFLAIKKVYAQYGSIENLFMENYLSAGGDIKKAISLFSENMIESTIDGKRISRGIKFMFPNPEKGSACKRMNLFLRWMVRKDELDFGLWTKIPKNKLLIPVDIHVARICTKLKLTSQKNVTWKMAEEITERLKTFDPVDPVKYDFAICHIGMRKLKF